MASSQIPKEALFAEPGRGQHARMCRVLESRREDDTRFAHAQTGAQRRAEVQADIAVECLGFLHGQSHARAVEFAKQLHPIMLCAESANTWEFMLRILDPLAHNDESVLAAHAKLVSGVDMPKRFRDLCAKPGLRATMQDARRQVSQRGIEVSLERETLELSANVQRSVDQMIAGGDDVTAASSHIKALGKQKVRLGGIMIKMSAEFKAKHDKTIQTMCDAMDNCASLFAEKQVQ